MTEREKKRHIKKVAEKKRNAKKFGEFFTPTPLANRMLDKFSEDSWHSKGTFLDPTCGNGQLLVEVIRRKLMKGHPAIQALFTTYGVEIQNKNTVECRKRILELLVAADDYGVINEAFYKKALNYTIVTEDALTFLSENVLADLMKRCPDIEIKKVWQIALSEGFKENMAILGTHSLTA